MKMDAYMEEILNEMPDSRVPAGLACLVQNVLDRSADATHTGKTAPLT